jgi:ABC-type polysaccharide/polyol phosphate transport system ATPase subunit
MQAPGGVLLNAVSCRNVSKSYPIYGSPGKRLKELLPFSRKKPSQEFWALKDLHLDIPRGSTFCIIGQNGSGKSTFLQIVAGILQPTTGTIKVNGRIAALLELGAGFNPEFTGRDNVQLSASIMGLSAAEVEAKFDSIEAFAEIGAFIDQPVQTYSSGMLVRLAFAVAIHVEPEILLVDEALAVGDIYFRQRCMRKVQELRQQGVTILFVSHAMNDVKTLGDRCAWIHEGKLQAVGDPDDVVAEYLESMLARDVQYQSSQAPENRSSQASSAPESIIGIPNVDRRFGNKRAEILGVAITDTRGDWKTMLTPGGAFVLRATVEAKDNLESPIVGFIIRNHLGVDLAASNTHREGMPLATMSKGHRVTVDFHIELPLVYPAPYSFTVAISDGDLDSFSMCDWVENAISLETENIGQPVYGYLHLPCRVKVNQVLSDKAST